MDFTDLMAQMRRNTEASNGLLEDTRLVAAMGSRLALSLFVSAIRPGAQLVGAVTCEAAALQICCSAPTSSSRETAAAWWRRPSKSGPSCARC
jgi:hypothetical protein